MLVQVSAHAWRKGSKITQFYHARAARTWQADTAEYRVTVYGKGRQIIRGGAVY